MAYPTSRLASLLLLTTSALASSPIQHLEAHETQPIAADSDERQPLVLAVPAAPEPTSPPFGRYLGSTAIPELLARAGTQSLCGYISGTAGNYPLTCKPGNTCTNSGTYRGCCFDSSCLSSEQFFTQCHDATDLICGSATTTLGGNTLCCTQTSLYPYCLTYLWSTSATPGKLFTQYNCDQQKFAGQYILAPEAPSSTSSAVSSSASGGASPSTSAVPGNSVAGTGGQDGGNNNTSNNNGGNSGSSASNNIGAIVGGVIGGVALLAIIAFAIWWFRNKKGKGSATTNNPPADAPAAPAATGAGKLGEVGAQPPMSQQGQPQYTQHSGQQQYPPPPGYDPRYSGYMPTSPSHADSVASYIPQQQQGGYHQQPYDSSTSPVPQQGSGGSGPNGYFPPPPQQQHSGGFVAEAPANNPVGVGGRRAELGS